MFEIILASQSPRRKELLGLAGYKFRIVPSSREEIISSTIPSEVVCELSFQKAKAVYEDCLKDIREKSLYPLVIGADTVVSVDGIILGKPCDEQDAFNMIKLLQGRSHEVYTGVTVYKSEEDYNTFFECTKVYFFPMTDEEIWKYIKAEETNCITWQDKAGAYGIQDSFGAKYIAGIEGDYYNVVGLPIARLHHELSKIEDI